MASCPNIEQQFTLVNYITFRRTGASVHQPEALGSRKVLLQQGFYA